MDIGELKELIKDLDNSMKVGGSGYLGEFLECWGAGVQTVSIGVQGGREEIFSISIENPGPDPD